MLEKQASKIEAEEASNRKKILDAMNKGQKENAQLYAENCIRLKKESVSTRRYGLKMGALSSKIESAHRAQQMSTTLANTVPALKSAMKQMEKAGVAGAVGDFEKVFEDMDVKTGEIDQLMGGIYASQVDNDEVANLINEVQGVQALESGQ